MQGVIFDLDGVLVCTDEYHFQAWKAIADEMNIPFDHEINNRLRGVGRLDSLNIILERYEGKPLTQKEKEELAEKKNTIYCALLKKLTPKDVKQEIRLTLQTIKKEGYKLAIGSSSKNTKTILRQVQLLDMFDVIIDGTMIQHSKPAPEVYSKAAKALQLEAEQCLVVEDAKAGIQAAHSANIKAITFKGMDAFGEADYNLDNFSQLENLLNQL